MPVRRRAPASESPLTASTARRVKTTKKKIDPSAAIQCFRLGAML
jgi:hypothetical protein